MTIPTITEYLGEVPNRREQSAEVFTAASITWTDYQADTFIPSINTTVEAMNLAVIAVNDDVTLSVDAAATASSSANYQGDWFVGAEALKGQSWSHDGLLWRAKQDGLVEPAEGAFWLLINAAKTISTKTSESAQDFIDSFALKIFQSPTDRLTEIQTRTLLGGEVYEVRKVSDGEYATIYSNAAGTTEIVQNGTSNVSDSDGVVVFYIDDGDYYIEVGSVSATVKVGNVSDNSLPYAFDTVADFKSSLIEFPVGKRVFLKDRQGYFSIVSGTSTGDDKSIIASNVVSQSLELTEEFAISVQMFGGDAAAAKAYALINNTNILVGPNDFVHGRANNTLITNAEAGATRVHIEPKGEVVGTKAKLDLMFDPYEDNIVDYRIQSAYTTDDEHEKTNGVAFWNVSSNGTNFGIWPRQAFTFNEGSNRGTALQLFLFDTSDTEWRTPYKSGWRTGLSYVIGDYITSSTKLYQATTAGTSGSTKPSHASGIVSDGGVSWEFIKDYAAASAAGAITGCALIGNEDDVPLHGFPDVRMQLAGDVLSQSGVKTIFTDNTGAEIFSLGTDLNTDNLYMRLASGGYVRFDNSGKFMQWGNISESSIATSFTGNETAPSIVGARVVVFGNSSATSVVDFDGGVGYQRFTVHTSNAQTTLVHGTNIKLSGGVDKILNPDEVLMFEMSGNGSIAKQVVS